MPEMTDDKNIFEKIMIAASDSREIVLTRAEVELLVDELGDALTGASNEFQKWQERLKEYEITSKAEAASKDNS